MKSSPIKKTHLAGAALFAAALALPSSRPALAEAAPEKGIVAFKYLNYEDKDTNPAQERIEVNAFSVMAMVPVAGKWSISTTYTNDSVSGASPSHYNAVSGASIKEHRQAVDLGLTRYFPRGTVTLGSSYSSENDYISRSYSALGSLSAEDKNTTFTLGGSYTTDTINPTIDKSSFYDKKSFALLAGITKVLTKTDIVQLNLGFSRGWGYFNDPYKMLDARPDRRESETVMTRWNHHIEGTDGTSRLSYRYYTDTFGIHAHTFGLEYVQPVAGDWTIIPSARYSSQTAADFYYPMPADGNINPTGKYSSLDQRLSAFGALTLGIKVEKRIAKEWLVDAKYESYEQRAAWSMTGGGDKGLSPFSATFVQFGISRQF
ncbi:MAG: DUF3570 domain-containing protein [Chlorobium sp.]|nr:MAG: DUF3570 domain-containing protein [Chlorobium sp.]